MVTDQLGKSGWVLQPEFFVVRRYGETHHTWGKMAYVSEIQELTAQDKSYKERETCCPWGGGDHLKTQPGTVYSPSLFLGAHNRLPCLG